MTREEQSELLEYWLAGLRCGALAADGISAELDGIILTAGADLPNAILDAALAATKGETPLAAVLRESLLDLGVGWADGAPISMDIYWALRRKLRAQWQSGETTMERAIVRMSLLTRQCGLGRPKTDDTLWEWAHFEDYYGLMLEGVYAPERVAEEFVRLMHEEEPCRLS